MGFVNLGEALYRPPIQIPESADIVWVADAFVEDYKGGAELTSDALLRSCPLEVYKLHSAQVTMEMLQQGFKKFWVFGNYTGLNKTLIPTICANLAYAIVEFDYKYCRYRSPEKHQDIERTPCGCNNEENGMLVSAFMHGAKSLWWMSEKQMEHYFKVFPFLREKIENTVLSSVFDDETFAAIKLLREKYKDTPRKGWVIIGSPSWIKGTEDAKRWCEENGHEADVVWGIPYDQVLERLAQAEGHVFLPPGGDTCPRMVIEAKLLGCKLHLNDNVQHKDEIWFDTDDRFDTEAYLYLARDRFWNGIKADMSFTPSISGYTTTKDCIVQDYPYEQCITSMLGFCDEVVVVDGGSGDGTWERLQELAKTEPRLVVHQQKRDWTLPRFAVYDGMQKALARSLCTKDMCWQMDSDEVVHENDYERIRKLTKFLPKNLPLLGLPVIEFWGGSDKVRMDITLWKWRLSRNIPHITHGVPRELRRFDEQGELFAAVGTDGCNYVKTNTFETIPMANFYTPDVERVRQAAYSNPLALQELEKWFGLMVENLPPIYHYSWFNIERKIRTYRDYWSRHWESLYNIKQEDTVENNKFFDKKWSEVTDGDIKELATKLGAELGGWVFHQRVDFTKKVPHMRLGGQPPAIMREWMERNGTHSDQG